jgi:AraC-like DNA-binding protein
MLARIDDIAGMEKIEQLAALIARHTSQEGICATVMPRVQLIRLHEPSAPVPAVYEASLCLIAQGAKRVGLGDDSVVYDASHYLLVSLDLPLTGHVIEASADAPYLCVKIDLDQTALADLLVAEGKPAMRSDLPVMAAYPSDPDLVDAACRLVALLDRPGSIAALAPLIEREILYRLLHGPHGAMLRYIASADSHLGQVSRAVAAIRRRFDAPLRIEEIASAAGMSPSSLHAHFKAVTRLTPIEYQKQLRLQEARRLMLTAGQSAGAAGFAVGYESPSQFSREYRRLFGAPPRQDVARLQAGASVEASMRYQASV